MVLDYDGYVIWDTGDRVNGLGHQAGTGCW